MPDRIREINTRFIEKVGIETTGNAYAKGQIIVLDNKKEPYDVGIYRADQYLFERTDWANAGINTVRDAYQKRVDDGCRTDLFWRLIGISTGSVTTGGGGPNAGVSTQTVTNYTIYCEQLNPAGYEAMGTPFPIPPPPDPFNPNPPAPPPLIYDPNKLYVMDQSSEQATLNGWNVYDLDTKFGLTPDEGENYHSWKVREEPYSEDLVDPILATGIGTIPLASNLLTFEELQPIDQLQPAITGIKTGGIINCDSEGIWFDNSTFIVAYGTTVVGLGTTSVAGVSTSAGTARKTWVETNDFAMREVNVPELNGTFTNFFVLKGPNDINYEKLALKRTSEDADELSPYTPQRVCPMTPKLIGEGVEIEYTNTGQPTACVEWNKFLLGLPDPADPVEIKDDADYEFKIVEEPKVGAGRIWYNQAFRIFPLSGQGNQVATRGLIRTLNRMESSNPILTPTFNYTIYSTSSFRPACPDLDNDLADKIDQLNDIESELADDLGNRNSKISKLYELTNALREERNELNLRIWAFRMQMGQGEQNVDVWDKRLNVINDPDFYDLLQTPLSDEERDKFTERRFPAQ